MPAGFQSFNSDGIYQIDGAYKNLFLKSKGVVTAVYDSGRGSGPNTYIASIPFNPSTGDILAVYSENNITVYWTKAAEQVMRVNGPGTVEYFIFSTAIPNTSTYGMQVFNNSGEIVFDALWKPFNVIGFITSAGAPAFQAGRKYAVVFLSQPTKSSLTWQWMGGGEFVYIVRQQYDTTFVRMSSSGVDVIGGIVWQVVGEGANPPAPPPMYDYNNNVPLNLMVIDVTNY